MHITKVLRKNATIWERRFWQIVRNRQLKGAKFRRQFKIGQYVVDFCCLEAKLIVELDGSQHDKEINRHADTIRQQYLENLGFKVLRFWNNEVHENLEGVAQKVSANL